MKYPLRCGSESSNCFLQNGVRIRVPERLTMRSVTMYTSLKFVGGLKMMFLIDMMFSCPLNPRKRIISRTSWHFSQLDGCNSLKELITCLADDSSWIELVIFLIATLTPAMRSRAATTTPVPSVRNLHVQFEFRHGLFAPYDPSPSLQTLHASSFPNYIYLPLHFQQVVL